MLAHVISFNLAVIPLKYLGVHILKGKPKISYFNDICDAIKVKLAT